jgi:hypothetical protein
MGKKEFKIKIKHGNIKYQIMSKIEEASVQYNDMKGSAALDFHGSFSELWDFAKDKGIDTTKYEPIGIDIYYGESNYFGLTFLVVDKEKAENRQSHNGLLPVIEISVEESQKDFERRFKRFNIKLTRLGMNLENYELIDSIDINDQIEDCENDDEI